MSRKIRWDRIVPPGRPTPIRRSPVLKAERDRLRAENERLRAELMIAERGHRFDGSNECQNCHAPRNSRQGKGKCPFARLRTEPETAGGRACTS